MKRGIRRWVPKRGFDVSEYDEIRKQLWNKTESEPNYPDASYRRDIMEQYRLCIEMADRISARRGAANTFFLSFNTAVVGALGTYFGALFKEVPAPVALTVYGVAIAFCLAWGLLLHSYRGLNDAKFQVIGLLEERLPSSPFWSAEWKALGSGEKWSRYIPLSVIERALPVVFIIAYIALGYLTINKPWDI